MHLLPDLAVPDAAFATPSRAPPTSALHRIEDKDDTTSASADLAASFPPPERADPAAEFGQIPSGRSGRGLFGSSDVWVRETAIRWRPRPWIKLRLIPRPGPVRNRLM